MLEKVGILEVKEIRPYTSFEITKMLEKADQRGRIAILLMSCSGI